MALMKPGCGSISGYMRHKRAGEDTCIACKAAWRIYYAERRKRQDRENMQQLSDQSSSD